MFYAYFVHFWMPHAHFSDHDAQGIHKNQTILFPWVWRIDSVIEFDKDSCHSDTLAHLAQKLKLSWKYTGSIHFIAHAEWWHVFNEMVRVLSLLAVYRVRNGLYGHHISTSPSTNVFSVIKSSNLSWYANSNTVLFHFRAHFFSLLDQCEKTWVDR